MKFSYIMPYTVMRFMLFCMLHTACRADEVKAIPPLIQQWYNDHTSLRTYLFSFPRSGNTWTRYCLEWLTKRPTLEKMKGSVSKYNRPIGLSLDMGIDLHKQPIWKMHTLGCFKQKFRSYHPDKETLIFILRNYKEVIPRHLGSLSVSILQNNNHAQKNYFRNIQLYDSWNPDKRLLIYYEDLITNPEQTLRLILSFLKEDDRYLASFMASYKAHKARSLDIYGKSTTQGNAVIHHSNTISVKDRKNIDTFVKNAYPSLWKKYLERYAEVKPI